MFFTKRLTLEEPIIFESNKERIININTISLESCDESTHSIDIYCENKRKKETFKICSLKKNSKEIYSTVLNLDLHNFKDKFEIKLKTKCKNAIVNIIGFFEEEENEGQEQEKEQKAIKNKNLPKYENKMKKNEKDNKKKEKEKNKDIKEKEKKKEDNNDNKEMKEEEKEKKDEKKKEKNDEKQKEKNSEDGSESKSDSDSDDNEIIEDNTPSVSIIELLKKKRKEEPQELKPVTLKNLSSTTNDKNKIGENKNKKKKNENNDKKKKKENKK